MLPSATGHKLFCKRKLRLIKIVWLCFLSLSTFVLMFLAIIQFGDECEQAPIPPSERHFKRCSPKREFVLNKKNKGPHFPSQEKVDDMIFQNAFTFHPQNRSHKEEGNVKKIGESVRKYFGSRRSSTNAKCISMFHEEEEKAVTFSPEGKENRFFMKTAPSHRLRWVFYKHKHPSNHLEIQWCPLFKSASSPFFAIFTKLIGALTEKTEGQIRNGKITFMNLASNFRLFASEGTSQNLEEQVPIRYTMVVVRHPFARLLSAYRDKLEGGRPFYYKKYGMKIIRRFRREKDKPFSRHSLSSQIQIATDDFVGHVGDLRRLISSSSGQSSSKVPTFEEFCRYLTTQEARTMDEHWRPQYLDCSPCHHNFDLILKVEDIERDRDQVFELLGFNETMTLEMKKAFERWSNRSPLRQKIKYDESFYFSQLSESLIQKLYEIYEPDFNLFGYSPEKYFNMTHGK